MAVKKLTSGLLRKIVLAEIAKFGDMEPTEDRTKSAEDTDADEFAGSLENHIDFIKALKIEDTRISKRLRNVREAKRRALRSIASRLA